MISAMIGMASLGGWAVFELGIPTGEPVEIIFGLAFGTFALAIGTVAATFVVAFYLCIFGLPVAVLLGDRIRQPWALAISLLDAGAAAIFAATGSRFGVLGENAFTPALFALILAFALPAGFLYRRNIIALREQANF